MGQTNKSVRGPLIDFRALRDLTYFKSSDLRTVFIEEGER